MHRHGFLLLVITLIATTALAGAQVIELLQNGEFSSWQDGRPVGWTVDIGATESEGPTSRLFRAEGPDGRSALRLQGDGATRRWYMAMHDPVLVNPGEIITATGQWRLADVRPDGHRFRNCQFGLLVFDAQGRRLEYRMVLRGQGSCDWTAGRAGFVVPPSAHHVQPALFLSMSGTVDFADLSVRRIVPATVPHEATKADIWAHDLDFLQTALEAIHPDPYHVTSAERFRAALDAIVVDGDGARDFALMKAVASLGDGHTSSGTVASRLDRVPVRLRTVGGDIVVLAADAAHAALLGGVVTHIGPATIDQVRGTMADYISHDNRWWLDEVVPEWLTVPGYLHGMDLVPTDTTVPFTVLSPAGESIAMDVPIADRPAAELGWRDILPSETGRPRHLQNRGLYWWEALPDDDAMYLRYVRCREMASQLMSAFAAEFLAAVDAAAPVRVVVDLRGNTGGSSDIFGPVIQGLAERSDGARGMRVQVLIDQATFSAAILNALHLRRYAGATLFGSPTGGKPNHFGEVQAIVLPNSQVPVRISSKWFRYTENEDSALQPDVTVGETLDDLRSGADPVLEAALRSGG